MKELFLGLIPFSSLLAVMSQEDLSFWERIIEKWGIGFIGLGLFVLLARWTAKREDALKAERDAKESANQKERVDLLTENNRLQAALLTAVNSHASIAERLTKEGTKASNDHAAALRQLVRKMKRPCVEFLTEGEFEKKAESE